MVLRELLRELGSLIEDQYPEFTSLSGVKSKPDVYLARLHIVFRELLRRELVSPIENQYPGFTSLSDASIKRYKGVNLLSDLEFSVSLSTLSPVYNLGHRLNDSALAFISMV